MDNLHTEAPFFYFSSTDEGTLVDVNETLCRHLGYTSAELTGQKQDLIFTLPTRIFQQTHLFPLLQMQGHAEEIFITLQTKEKAPVPVLINAVRHTTTAEGLTTYAGIVVHNRQKFEEELIAARKAAEKALHENTALQEAKKALQEHAELLDQQMELAKKQNEELRQFNHVVTHELQEPLRKLFFFTGLLQENGDASLNTKTAAKIKSVAEQMRSILSGLQQYVWLIEAPVKRTLINLNGLLEEIAASLQKEHPQITINLAQEQLPRFEGDEEQVRCLFSELFSNAIRFRSKQQEVTISVTGSEVFLNKFRNVAGKYHFTSFLKLQIKDDGCGFDSVYKEQAFALFKRLHINSGRGVGLSLCKKIVENHHGSIALDSRTGEGTVITLNLPIQPSSDDLTGRNKDTHPQTEIIYDE